MDSLLCEITLSPSAADIRTFLCRNPDITVSIPGVIVWNTSAFTGLKAVNKMEERTSRSTSIRSVNLLEVQETALCKVSPLREILRATLHQTRLPFPNGFWYT